MILLGFTGRARNGKTTAADAIQRKAQQLGMSVNVYDIGAIIIQHCVEVGLLAPKPREERTPEELAITQKVGLEKRQEREDVWIENLKTRLTFDAPDVALIPNTRYRNEVELVKSAKHGFLIHTMALNPNGSPYIATDRDPNHPSETTVTERDSDFFIVAKRPGVDIVRAQAVAIFETILSRIGFVERIEDVHG